MTTFADTAGDDWIVKIDVTAAKRVKERLQIDILKLLDTPGALTALQDDYVRFVDILFVVCQPQAQSKGISDVQFGERLVGDVIGRAQDAFLHGLVDFFPQHRREPLRRAIQKLEQIQTTASRMQVERMDDPEMTRQIETIIRQSISGGSFINAQGQPG